MYAVARLGIDVGVGLVVVGAVVAFWLGRERGVKGGVRFSRRSAGAAILTAAVLGAGLLGAGVVLLRGHGFGVIRIAYLLLTVVPTGIAIVGLAAGFVPRWRTCRSVRALGGVGLLAGLLGGYVSFIAPYQLEVERATHAVVGMKKDAAPIRIVVLADIQTDQIGAHEHRAVDLALAQQPDIIVLPGDFLQGPRGEMKRLRPAFRALMSRLEAPGGVYACVGNIDWEREWTERLFEGTGVRFLFNEIAHTRVRGTDIAIGGVEYQFFKREPVATIRALGDADADVRLLLCHNPNGVMRCEPSDRIDLLIAGHTHGGQIQVPGYGPLMNVAEFVPREVAGGGLHRARGQWLYVSRGVGVERGLAPPMRLFCPPEVSVVELVGSDDAAR